jgi:CRP-like cAMP-binding protein
MFQSRLRPADVGLKVNSDLAGGAVVGLLIADRIRAFLKQHSIFGSLPDSALSALVRKGRTKTYSAGEFICRREEQGETLMVIVTGWVKITNSNPDGKEIVLNFLGPGDTSGEIALFDGNGRSADVVALGATEVFIVYARDLMPLLAAHPQTLFDIIQSLCERLRVASAIIEDNSLDMRRRIARGLLRLVLQHGRISKEGIRVSLTLSQSELGAYLGLSRENVNRQLGHLRDANVIRNDGPQIIITNECALRKIAGWTSTQC